jgi:hypothetical protein
MQSRYPRTLRVATRHLDDLDEIKTNFYIGLDDHHFMMRHAFSDFAALRHLAALLDAVAAVGAVRLHAGLDDAAHGGAGRGTPVGSLNRCAATARLSAVRPRRAVHFARHVESVLLRVRPGAGKHERKAEDLSHPTSGRACGGAGRS